jgi:SAM-dependent methyltransferase
MLRDIALFLHSVAHARAWRPRRYYWDATRPQELDHVVELLSNPQDPERIEIRRVLADAGVKTLLDAGCGPATELAGYRQAGLTLRYTGLDGSQRMLGVARDRHPDARFVRGALERMPFANESFDAVLLKHVLEHQADYRPVLNEALRVARRMVIINFFHRLLPVRRDIRLMDRRGFWNNWYSRPSFTNLLKALGVSRFEVIRTRGTARQTAEIYLLTK